MIDKNTVIALAEERIAELDKGLFLVDVTISSANVIHVEIDAESTGVSIDDCVRVSRNIEHNLDRDQNDFELNVSSAGLDKPLRVHKQYVKNVGRSLKVLNNEGLKLEGVLQAVTDSGIELEFSHKEKVEGKKKKVEITERKTISFENIKEAKIVITFK